MRSRTENWSKITVSGEVPNSVASKIFELLWPYDIHWTEIKIDKTFLERDKP